MFVSRSLAIFRHNTRLMLSDPAPLITYLVMPLIMMAFLQPMGKAILAGQGFSGSNGTEQVVPGMTVMFAFLSVSTIGVAFYREHGWGTWNRLRASNAGLTEVLLGKALPWFIMTLCQIMLLFAAGWLFFGLRCQGSFPALLLVMATLPFCLVAITLAWLSVCRTLDQFIVFSNLVGMVWSGLGGALAPAELLPDWGRWLANFSPAYWAIKGFRQVILEGAGVGTVLPTILALAAFGGVALLITALRFRYSDAKVADT